LHVHTIFSPGKAVLFNDADQFPCNCAFNLCCQLEMLIFQDKSEFGEGKRAGGGEVGQLWWVKKLCNLPVIQKLLHSCSVM
jgi:hypothetical protein